MLNSIIEHKTYKSYIQQKIYILLQLLSVSIITLFAIFVADLNIVPKIIFHFLNAFFFLSEIRMAIITFKPPKKYGVAKISKIADTSHIELFGQKEIFFSMDYYLGNRYSYRIEEEVYWLYKNGIYYFFKKY